MKITKEETDFRLKIGNISIRFENYEKRHDDIIIGDTPSTLIYLYEEMAIEFEEKMEELKNKKEISKGISKETLKTALDCFRENDKVKFSKIKYELHINMEPTEGYYSECEEFFKTVDGEIFKLRWDYYHLEILEISRP